MFTVFELKSATNSALAIAVLSFSLQHAATAQLRFLHSFGDGMVANDGAKPEAGFVQAPNGDFFGVTDIEAVNPTPAGGNVFQMTPAGKLRSGPSEALP